jgi:hypothetical protein
MPPSALPQAARQAIMQHWQSAFWWLCPGSRPTTAPLAVHRTMLSPVVSLAAMAADANDQMAAWSKSAQTTTREMQSLSLRSHPMLELLVRNTHPVKSR